MKTCKQSFSGKRPARFDGYPVIMTLAASVIMILLTLFHFPASGQNPAFRSLYATSGSRAPWGYSQGVKIDVAGNGKVYQSDIETGITDSVSVTLTAAQMQAIVDTAVAAGFFSLNGLYNSGALDGTFVRVEINTSSSSKSVEVRNLCVRAMNRVVWTINAKISNAKGYRLEYNFMNSNCP